VAMTGVLAGVFLFNRAGDDGAHASASETRTSVLVDNFYSKDNPLLPHDPARPQPATPPAAEPASKPATKVASLAPRPHPAEGPVHLELVTRPDPPRMAGATRGKADSFDPDALGPTDPLTPDDVRNAYAANEVGLKRCYERSLKVDPTSNVSKMVVKITITAQGTVSDISVPDKASELAGCLAASIRSWRFRRSAGEFTTEFTVFFAKRG
jgi:hypothetical protein